MLLSVKFWICVVLLSSLLSIACATGVNTTSSVVCGHFQECDSCRASEGCGWCYNEGQCKNLVGSRCASDLYQDSCPSFWNIDLLIGTSLIFCGGVLASGGGVGGGGIYIPVLVLALKFSPHVAVPISKITIFGVAIGGFIILSRKRHPKANRPLIDFDVAFMMEPMTLLGSIIGVYMNIVFPTYLLIVFLVVVLGYNAYKTLTKGVTLYKQEKKSPSMTINTQAEAAPLLSSEIDRNHLDVDLAKLIKQDSKTPVWQMFVLFTMELGMLVFLLLKGSASGESLIGVSCGTWEYWLLVCVTVPYLIVFTLIAGRYLRNRHQRKLAAGYRYLKEDVQWTYKRTLALPCLFILAGMAAGFLGIGAGLVVGPIFLDMGLVPQVAVATSSYMILYTSFSTAAQFLILGRLPWDYAIWYFCVGVISAMIGQAGLSEIIRRYKKQAFINFLLGSVIALSVLTMGILEGITVVYNVQHHVSMGFNSVCATGS